jgi:DNA polymerase III epsilon subunit-like protein
MHLIFDTETTGLPKSYTDFTRPDTPRLVTLTALLCDESYNIQHTLNVIIKPDGFDIPEAASNVHGITTTDAHERGIPLSDALDQFAALATQARYLVAHNLGYDLLIMRGELHRLNRNIVKVPFHYCTKENSTNICRIPGRYGKYKWPTLTEACSILINHTFDAHNSFDDTHACLLLYKHLRSLEQPKQQPQ